MLEHKSTFAYTLSVIIAVLTLGVSLGGLLIDGVYRDNALLTGGWFGNDLVTLFVALPIFVSSLILSIRGSQRARLVWIGMLDYTLYNFAYYLFGAAFNVFFLAYVALFTLSILALIFALADLNVDESGGEFRAGTPVRWIAGYMMFVALGLTIVYSIESVKFIATGHVPEIVTLSNHPTNVVFALDLSLVVPWFILGAIWLWQRRPWGYVLSTIVNVKGAVYMLALTAVTISGARATGGDPSQAGLWIAFGVGSLLASLFLLGNVGQKRGA